jgi:hypothetical protein
MSNQIIKVVLYTPIRNNSTKLFEDNLTHINNNLSPNDKYTCVCV